MNPQKVPTTVTPAEAGIQSFQKILNSGFRREPFNPVVRIYRPCSSGPLSSKNGLVGDKIRITVIPAGG